MLTYITNNDIINLNLSYKDANKLVEKAFLNKKNSLLPVKTSIAFGKENFFNTMPVIIPYLNIIGVKLISR